MEKEKNIIEKKDKEKESFISEYHTKEKDAVKAIADGLRADAVWSTFWYKFTLYRIYNELEFKTIADYIESKFEVSGVGKSKRIEQIRQRIKYLSSLGNPAKKSIKNNQTKKTDFERAKEICDKLAVDDLISLQGYIEQLLSNAEEIEEEEKEEKKLKKAA